MTQLDLDFIEQNAEIIIPNIRHESVEVYRFLCAEFNKSKVDKNYLFQFVFRSFYRIDNAGLTSAFKKRYFELLEDVRNAESIDIANLVKELQKYPNLKGQETLQFSFATKLANTANSKYPIYDSEVARMFDFKTPGHAQDSLDRLDKYINFYQELRESYEAIIANEHLKSVRDLFRTTFSTCDEDFPEMKMIDFIVWQAGKLKKHVKKT